MTSSVERLVAAGASQPVGHLRSKKETTLIYALRYFWRVSKGHRLRPWQSPYLRWRLETFFGVHADSLTRQEFCRLLWGERRRLRAFLRWAEEMESRYFPH